MTLLEIEQLLIQMQRQITANTAAITTLNNTISNYATTDDLNAIATNLNILQQRNVLIQNDLNALKDAVDNSDHLHKLIDVDLINPLTEGDILCYGDTGKWHNIPSKQIISNESGSSGNVTKLNDLSDVQLTSLSDGHGLIYSAAIGKWTNDKISDNTSSSVSGNYLTRDIADGLYLSKFGGTVNGELTVQGSVMINNNLLVKKGITFYNEQ